jgi:integrase
MVRPANYLIQPRGRGYAFRISIPPALREQFPSKNGKPQRRIVKGLDTADPDKAERLAAQLRAEWLAKFERAALNVPLSDGEIVDAARECRTATLARLHAEADVDDAAIFLPAGLELRRTALESGDPKLAMPEIEALERRLGLTVERSSPTFNRLAMAILRAQKSAYEGRLRLLEGQPTPEPEPATFLGPEGIDPKTLKAAALPRPLRNGDAGPWALFEAWVAAVKPAVATVGRWRVVFETLQEKFKDQRISEREAQAWLDSLVDPEGKFGPKRSAYTVDNIYLSAARRIYAWALKRKMIDANPFAACSIDVPKKEVERTSAYTSDEVATILKAASASDASSLFGGAKRWIPWLAYYTGARAGELCQLRSQDVRCEGGIWFIELTPDAGPIKSGIFRQVPLHEHLIEQGFLTFVKTRNGPLFYRPRLDDKNQNNAKPRRPRPVKTRERLAEWVRSSGVDDTRISPLHASRHLFKQIGRRHIPEHILDAICGHSPTTEGRAYGAPLLSDLAREMAKFPRCKL